MTDCEALLKIEELHLSLPNRRGRGRTELLRGVSFTVPRGKTVGLVGESGCGKSMTALCVMGLLLHARTEGSIFFDGNDITGFSEEDWLDVRGNGISMIFQEPMTSLNPVFCGAAAGGAAAQSHEAEAAGEAGANPRGPQERRYR